MKPLSLLLVPLTALLIGCSETHSGSARVGELTYTYGPVPGCLGAHFAEVRRGEVLVSRHQCECFDCEEFDEIVEMCDSVFLRHKEQSLALLSPEEMKQERIAQRREDSRATAKKYLEVALQQIEDYENNCEEEE